MSESARAALTPVQPESGSDVSARPSMPPESVLGRLREQYATAGEERREVFPILPGRFNDSLAMEAHPVEWKGLRRRIRQMVKTGQLRSEEGELNFAGEFVASACEQILVRTEDGGEWKPLHKAAPSLGSTCIRFDERLCKALKIDLAGQDLRSADIVRLLFRNPAALDTFYVQVDLWNKEALGGDEEDEAVRPTD